MIVKPAFRIARTCAKAIFHFSRKTTVSGRPTRARRSASSVHDVGTYRSNARGHVRSSAISALETATWQLPTLPSAPQYWRCTPTESVPCLGNPVSSMARMPARTGTTARSCVHTRSASHGESVMKCCRA